MDGIDVKEKPEATKRLFAYIPDDPQLYDRLTGIQYLNFICDVFSGSAPANASAGLKNIPKCWAWKSV